MLGRRQRNAAIRFFDGSVQTIDSFPSQFALMAAVYDDGRAQTAKGIDPVDLESLMLANYGFQIGLPESPVAAWGDVRVISTVAGQKSLDASALMTTEGMAIWWKARPLYEAVLVAHESVSELRGLSESGPEISASFTFEEFIYLSRNGPPRRIRDGYLALSAQLGRDPVANRRNVHLVATWAMARPQVASIIRGQAQA